MIKFNEVISDYEPRKKISLKLREFVGSRGRLRPEMSEFESAFLCGLLEICRPKKILEVGLASGGSTAMILQLLEDIGAPYEMHSVDISEKLYYRPSLETGLLAKFAKENNLFTASDKLNGTHKFHLGKYLPQVIDEIGGDIDFVVLDTVHYTPGELFDFPVMLPYLKNDAIVVLHDVSLNQLKRPGHTSDAHATGLLLSVVTAEEKFLNSESKDKNLPFAYPNIAAFRVNEQTREHIENIFLALMLTWHYLPKEDEVKIYREFYERYYSSDLLAIFNETVRFNFNNTALTKK